MGHTQKSHHFPPISPVFKKTFFPKSIWENFPKPNYCQTATRGRAAPPRGQNLYLVVAQLDTPPTSCVYAPNAAIGASDRKPKPPLKTTTDPVVRGIVARMTVF